MTTVRVRLPDGTAHVGRVVDLRDVERSGDAATVRRSIRSGFPLEPDVPRVYCPAPTRCHRFADLLSREMSFDRYGALATLARTRGHTASEERTLAHVRDELAETAAPAPEDLTTARRRAAEAGAETERLRERAATIRGRLEATRDAGADAEAVERELEETMRRLSEVATERVAARQRLDVQETQARAARDSRERRMRLEDRIANLRRTIRRSLAETVYEEFGGAVTALPDAFDADAGDEPGGYDGEPVAAALAFARVAPLRAPVVVEATVAERFENAATLARYLRGPLVVC